MAFKKLVFPLSDGFVMNWLVLGPILEKDSPSSQPRRPEDVTAKYAEPVEYGYAYVPGREAKWKYFRCGENHQVELAVRNPGGAHVWYAACAELDPGKAQDVSLRIVSSQPSQIFLDNEPVEADQNGRIRAHLSQTSPLFVICEAGNEPVYEWLLSVEVQDASGEVKVNLPTQARHPRRFVTLEQQLATAHLEESVNHKGARFNLRWGEGTSDDFNFHYQVQDEDERIYVEGTWQPEQAGTDIGHTIRLNERNYRIVLRAPAREYYEMNNRYQVELPLTVLDTDYRSEPSGSYAARRKNALTYASRRSGTVASQAALLLLDKPKDLDAGLLVKAAQENDLHSIADLTDLALLGKMVLRGLPRGQGEVKDAILGALERVWETEEPPSFVDNDSQILWLAVQLLAARAGRKSKRLKQAEADIVDWIKAKGPGGLEAGYSPAVYEPVIAALELICTYTKADEAQELAAVMLDRLLFDLASHSYKGTVASAHLQAVTGAQKSGQLEPTSGLMRMLFGTGVYNRHLTALLSLADAAYEFPSFLADIAVDAAKEQVTREMSAGAALYTWRDKHGALSSLQDWKGGEKGKAELVWKATLGVDTPVFVTAPRVLAQGEAFLPGYWLGNNRLPQVAQWKDVLVAIYTAGEGGLGFTHAFFPTYKFDEHKIQDGWAFARVGDGYLALTAARGIQMTKEGQDAYRELRSYGFPNIWICQMGNKSQDGNFDRFTTRVGKMKLEWGEDGVTMKTIRGTKLAFGVNTPLVVDGASQSLDFASRFTSPYCTKGEEEGSLDISFAGNIYRLIFA